MKLTSITLAFSLSCAPLLAADPVGIPAVDKEGKHLNLGFEDGTLTHWTAEGKAFEKQPLKGDVVAKRRNDMKSQHVGEYWVGTFENGGDDLTGTLTSVPFKVTHRYASFYIGGGSTEGNRIELVTAADKKVFYKASGLDAEGLRPVVLDLEKQLGQEIFVRVVDHQIGGWGHTNFDDFRFHAEKPQFANAIPPEVIARQNTLPKVDEVKFEGLSGEEAAKEITLPPGFKSTLFAAEPDIQQPIAFCIDDRGRLWVAEGHTYPKRAPEGQGRDKILIFEDTNGDGKFDSRKLFMDKLNLVSGLEVGFDGVWIGAAPHLLFVADKNHDDQPDGEPTVLLDGWDYVRDTHETLNTFIWGPDGWLYGCHGVFCPSFVGKPGTAQENRQRVDAGVWRYHPTQHRFEVFAEGTSNPWGIDFNDYGQCFIEACVVPHLWHIIQGARYQRQGGQHYSINQAEMKRVMGHLPPNGQNFLNPFIYEDIKTIADHFHWAGEKGPHAGNNRSDAAGGGHAHAGLMAYLGGQWPAEYRDSLFMNNIHGQRINRDKVERKGSGYVGKHAPDFLNFNDKWSQVLNLQYDQDGSVFMIDWYDKNQCHHNNVNGHDRSNGRIFKITYGDVKTSTVDLQKKTDAELVQLQLHKNDWQVRHARRILQERAAAKKLSPDVAAGLKKILATNPDVTRQLRALWALQVTGLAEESLLLGLLKNPSEYVRAWSIQFLAENENPSAAALAEFARLAKDDPSPFVRLYLASALQRTPVEKRVPILDSLLAHAEDESDHNLPLMYWYALEPVVGSDSKTGVTLMTKSRIPVLRQYITRRISAGSKTVASDK